MQVVPRMRWRGPPQHRSGSQFTRVCPQSVGKLMQSKLQKRKEIYATV